MVFPESNQPTQKTRQVSDMKNMVVTEIRYFANKARRHSRILLRKIEWLVFFRTLGLSARVCSPFMIPLMFIFDLGQIKWTWMSYPGDLFMQCSFDWKRGDYAE